jgi:hypothetical protein
MNKYLNRFVNNKSKLVVGIRFKKFSIGVYNQEAKRCEKSWLEIDERDYELEPAQTLLNKTIRAGFDSS